MGNKDPSTGLRLPRTSLPISPTLPIGALSLSLEVCAWSPPHPHSLLLQSLARSPLSVCFHVLTLRLRLQESHSSVNGLREGPAHISFA